MNAESLDGAGNETGVREVPDAVGADLKCLHLHFRVHVLPDVHSGDELRVPQLQR